ncbi:MAG: hypothetical protein F6K50_38700 [Moorea sp. SIO3I7]|nr:hypothetical protein [Moorena sp. SIO3I7]
MSGVGILPAVKISEARCLFHKTLEIIPLLSNAPLLITYSGLQTPVVSYMVLIALQKFSEIVTKVYIKL